MALCTLWFFVVKKLNYPFKSIFISVYGLQTSLPGEELRS